MQMSHLNSVLIEGEVSNDPSPYDGDRTDFTLKSIRLVKNTNGTRIGEDINYFRVKVQGNLAEVCAANLKKGRGVRIVGRLVALPDKLPYIHAEHVEFKPQ